MLAYAANRPQFAAKRPSPRTLLLVIAIHAAVVVAVLTMKTNLPTRIIPPPIVVDLLRDKPPPPEHVVRPQTLKTLPEVTRTESQVPIPPLQVPVIDANPKLPDIRDLIGPSIPTTPNVEPPVVPLAATIARLLTPQSELRPPYPESKLMTGEETTLNLRLTIDEQGRVADVAAIGSADRVFLEAARRYLIAHWRYKPATREGRAVASNLTITLRFELD
jgi:protein TonB